jgi:HEAT repeat protein
VPVLLDRLERDPSSAVRNEAAQQLGTQPGSDVTIDAALAAAAEDDEDVEVRWTAAYTLRMKQTV